MEDFDGFRPDALKFFADIKRHNNREWVLKNKARYQQSLVAPASALVEALNRQKSFQKLGLSMNPKKALFRLNRDVRFSADKSLYKTHNGIVLTRSGQRGDDAGVFYVHLEPKACFFGVGFWMPDPKLLTRFRLKLVEDKKARTRLLQHLKKSQLTLSSEGQLKRGPKGFEHISDPQLVELLKLKNFLVSQDFKDSDLYSKTLVTKAAAFLERSKALLEWAWPVVEEWRLESGLDL